MDPGLRDTRFLVKYLCCWVCSFPVHPFTDLKYIYIYIIILYILCRKEFGRKRSSESDKWKLKWVMLIDSLRPPRRHTVLGSRGRWRSLLFWRYTHLTLNEAKREIMNIEQLSWTDKGLWMVMESVCFSFLKEAKLFSIGGKYYGFGQ